MKTSKLLNVIATYYDGLGLKESIPMPHSKNSNGEDDLDFLDEEDVKFDKGGLTSPMPVAEIKHPQNDIEKMLDEELEGRLN